MVGFVPWKFVSAEAERGLDEDSPRTTPPFQAIKPANRASTAM